MSSGLRPLHRGLRSAALLASLGVASCASLPPPVRTLPPEDPRPAQRMAELRQLSDERRSLRATTRVALEGAAGASAARQLVLLERPARLRLEVLGLLGQRVAILATDGEHYELYRAQAAPQIESGAVHEAILWQVAGVPLRPQDAVDLLLGTPRLPPGSPEPRAELAADEALLLSWEAVTLEFDAAGRLRRYAVHPPHQAEPLLEARYAEHDASGFARSVDLAFPSNGARAQVSFREVELNPVLPAELFRLRPQERVSSPPGGAAP